MHVLDCSGVGECVRWTRRGPARKLRTPSTEPVGENGAASPNVLGVKDIHLGLRSTDGLSYFVRPEDCATGEGHAH